MSAADLVADEFLKQRVMRIDTGDHHMNRLLILTALAVLFTTGAKAGDGKDHIDRRDGVSYTYRSHDQMQHGRASTDEKPDSDFTFDPRREDDR
jgi:hypothetical protein